MSGEAYSNARQATAVGDYNSIAFAVAQLLAGRNHATLVRVETCTNDGGLEPAGRVTLTPLVNQLDGNGQPVQHGPVYDLPYLRVQGGDAGIICDPSPGDIGLAVFADRDITAVLQAQGPANPGSFRRNDFSDGMYVASLGFVAPTRYLRFGPGVTELVDPAQIRLAAPTIVLDGETRGTGEVYAKYGSGDQVSVTQHEHTQPNDSHGDAEQPTAAPTPGT